MATKAKKKILVIDDENFVRKVFSGVLAKEGFDVATAQNGKAGIDKAKEFKPDLIILDILMPVMNGIEFLKEKKKQESIKAIPVIVLSAYSGPQYVKQVMDLGAKEYLGKTDNDLNKIASKVKKLLNIQ